MNSRLNLSIREKYGYTYNIESGYSAFKDTGLFHCYFSTEKKYLYKAIDLINKELNLVKSKYTFTIKKEEVLLKQNAGKKQGYLYEIWIFDNKKKRCEVL